MDLSSITNTSAIQRFLFVVNEPSNPSNPALLFPNECTGCSSSTSPCPSANVCVRLNGCGFSVSESGFEAKIDFSDFEVNSNIRLVACATNGADAVLAAGSTTFQNTAGTQTQVVLTASSTACTILPVCP